ncbi:MAG: hypothetical protein N2166_06435 [candidate division WOR-3 bacterium]|nr:hypothetical protein [candidate division WOR-3 bacterium]
MIVNYVKTYDSICEIALKRFLEFEDEVRTEENCVGIAIELGKILLYYSTMNYIYLNPNEYEIDYSICKELAAKMFIYFYILSMNQLFLYKLILKDGYKFSIIKNYLFKTSLESKDYVRLVNSVYDAICILEHMQKKIGRRIRLNTVYCLIANLFNIVSYIFESPEELIQYLSSVSLDELDY